MVRGEKPSELPLGGVCFLLLYTFLFHPGLLMWKHIQQDPLSTPPAPAQRMMCCALQKEADLRRRW